MNSKLLAAVALAVAFVAVVVLVPADEADAVSDTVDGTVDSPTVFGEGDVATVGENITFTGSGRLIMGSGSTLVVNGSVEVTGSGEIIEFQPGSYVTYYGTGQTFTSPTVITLDGHLSMVYEESETGMMISIDLDEGDIFGIGDNVSIGSAGTDVKITVGASGEYMVLGIIINIGEAPESASPAVMENVAVDVSIAINQVTGAIEVGNTAGNGPGTVSVGSMTYQGDGYTIAISDLEAEVDIASNGAIALDAGIGSVVCTEKSSATTLTVTDVQTRLGILFTDSGFEITGYGGTGSATASLGSVNMEMSMGSGDVAVPITVSAGSASATFTASDNDMSASIDIGSAYGSIALDIGQTSGNPLGVDIRDLTVDVSLSDDMTDINMDIGTMSVSGDAAGLVFIMLGGDASDIGHWYVDMDVNDVSVEIVNRVTQNGYTETITASVGSASGSADISGSGSEVLAAECEVEGAVISAGTDVAFTADRIYLSSRSLYASSISEEITGFNFGSSGMSADTYRLDAVAYTGGTGSLAGTNCGVTNSGIYGNFTADFDGQSFKSLYGYDVFGSLLFTPITVENSDDPIVVGPGMDLNLVDGTTMMPLDIQGGNVNGTAVFCFGSTDYINSSDGTLILGGSGYDIAVTFEDSRITGAVMSICDQSSSEAYDGFSAYDPASGGMPYTVSADGSTATLDLSEGLGIVNPDLEIREYTVTIGGVDSTYEYLSEIPVEPTGDYTGEYPQDRVFFAGFDDGDAFTPVGETYVVMTDAEIKDVWIYVPEVYEIADGALIVETQNGAAFVPNMSDALAQMADAGVDTLTVVSDIGSISFNYETLAPMPYLMVEMRVGAGPFFDYQTPIFGDRQIYNIGVYTGTDISLSNGTVGTITLDSEGAPALVQGNVVEHCPYTSVDGQTSFGYYWSNAGYTWQYMLEEVAQAPEPPASDNAGDSGSGSGGMDTMIIAAIVIVVIVVVVVVAVVVMRRRNVP